MEKLTLATPEEEHWQHIRKDQHGRGGQIRQEGPKT